MTNFTTKGTTDIISCILSWRWKLAWIFFSQQRWQKDGCVCKKKRQAGSGRQRKFGGRVSVSFSRSPGASPRLSDLEFQINNSTNLKTLVHLCTHTQTQNGVYFQSCGLFKMGSQEFEGIFDQCARSEKKASTCKGLLPHCQVLILKA